MPVSRRRWNVAAAASLALALAALGACGQGGPAKPSKPADPMADPAAWKALPAADRAARAAEFVAQAHVKTSSAAESARAFLVERGEDAAAADVVAKRLAVDPNCAWAHGVRGEIDVGPRASQCLKECELCDAACTEDAVALGKYASAACWVDAATAKKVDDLVAAVRKDEAHRSNPYEAGIDRWVKWQRGYRVMSELPELHATTGPYVLFVSIGGEKPDHVSKQAEDRARAILNHDTSVLDGLYAAWTKEIAAPLHLPTYGPSNADETTILKADVFTEAKDYYVYQWATDWWNEETSWAHYVDSEPHFLAAMTADSGRALEAADAGLRVEAVRQLVHFHTWDATRKSRGRELDWEQCLVRPLWSADGFPTFFGDLARGSASRPWLADLFVGRGVAEKKQLPAWTTKELLAMKDRAALEAAARHRGGAAGDAGAAALAELFHARAAGLVDFLWNAGDAGRPKWRDRYLSYLGDEMVAKTRVDRDGREIGVRFGEADLRRALGLSSDADFAAFEKEWTAYETSLLEREKAPWWTERLTKELADADAPKGR